MDRFAEAWESLGVYKQRFWDKVPWHVRQCRTERAVRWCVVRWWFVLTLTLCTLTQSLQPLVVCTTFLALLGWWYYGVRARGKGRRRGRHLGVDGDNAEDEGDPWEAAGAPPPLTGRADHENLVAPGPDYPNGAVGAIDPAKLPPCPAPFQPDPSAPADMLVSCARTRFQHAVQRPTQRDEQAIRLWERQMDTTVRPAEDPDIGPAGPSRAAFMNALRMQPNHKYTSIFRQAQTPLVLDDTQTFKVPFVATRAVNPVRADATAKSVPQWPVYYGGRPLDFAA